MSELIFERQKTYSRGGMEPAPVRIQDDFSGDRGARATSGAVLPAEGGVGLSSESTNLLSANARNGKSEKSNCLEHLQKSRD